MQEASAARFVLDNQCLMLSTAARRLALTIELYCQAVAHHAREFVAAKRVPFCSPIPRATDSGLPVLASLRKVKRSSFACFGTLGGGISSRREAFSKAFLGQLDPNPLKTRSLRKSALGRLAEGPPPRLNFAPLTTLGQVVVIS